VIMPLVLLVLGSSGADGSDSLAAYPAAHRLGVRLVGSLAALALGTGLALTPAVQAGCKLLVVAEPPGHFPRSPCCKRLCRPRQPVHDTSPIVHLGLLRTMAVDFGKFAQVGGGSGAPRFVALAVMHI
jgi:hypothetical protein